MKKALIILAVYMAIGLPFLLAAGWGGQTVKMPFGIPSNLPKPVGLVVSLLLWPFVLWASRYQPSSDTGSTPIAIPMQ